MIQLNAVFFILLVEAAVLLLALSVFLAWRLLRQPWPTLSTPDDLRDQARRFLESELSRTDGLLASEPPAEAERHAPLERRRQALEAELAALAVSESESAYWSQVEAGYALPEAKDEPPPEDGAEENEQEAAAALEALRADYQALLDVLRQAELDEDSRQAVDAAADRCDQRLVIIEQTLGVGGRSGSADTAAPDSGDRERLHQIIGQQDELIWDLKREMASAVSDSEKLRYLEDRVEDILRQARELEACVNVLEDENNFLFQQLRERDAEQGGDEPNDRLDRAHLGFLLANQQQALQNLETAINGLQASDERAEDVFNARGALSELLTCAESLKANLGEAPADAAAEQRNS